MPALRAGAGDEPVGAAAAVVGVDDPVVVEGLEDVPRLASRAGSGARLSAKVVARRASAAGPSGAAQRSHSIGGVVGGGMDVGAPRLSEGDPNRMADAALLHLAGRTRPGRIGSPAASADVQPSWRSRPDPRSKWAVDPRSQRWPGRRGSAAANISNSSQRSRWSTSTWRSEPFSTGASGGDRRRPEVALVAGYRGDLHLDLGGCWPDGRVGDPVGAVAAEVRVHDLISPEPVIRLT